MDGRSNELTQKPWSREKRRRTAFESFHITETRWQSATIVDVERTSPGFPEEDAASSVVQGGGLMIQLTGAGFTGTLGYCA